MARLAYLLRVAAIVAGIFAFTTFVAAQTDTVYKLPAGTLIRLKMDAEINSKAATPNDTFVAYVVDPVSIHDEVVVPKGTLVEGRVVDASPAAVGGQNGRLELTFEKITISNAERSIEGTLVNKLAAERDRRFGIFSVLAGAVAGTAIGAATGSGNRAAIGAGIGAGAGTSVALLRKGHDVRIKPDQEFDIELKYDVLLPVLDD